MCRLRAHPRGHSLTGTIKKSGMYGRPPQWRQPVQKPGAEGNSKRNGGSLFGSQGRREIPNAMAVAYPEAKSGGKFQTQWR